MATYFDTYTSFTNYALDLTVFRGDTLNLGFAITSGATGQPANLTTCTVYFTVKKEIDDPLSQVVIKKQTPVASGITLKGGDYDTSGLCMVNIPTGESYYLQTGPYFYGVQLVTGSHVETVGTGVFNVRADITRRTWPSS